MELKKNMDISSTESLSSDIASLRRESHHESNMNEYIKQKRGSGGHGISSDHPTS